MQVDVSVDSKKNTQKNIEKKIKTAKRWFACKEATYQRHVRIRIRQTPSFFGIFYVQNTQRLQVLSTITLHKLKPSIFSLNRKCIIYSQFIEGTPGTLHLFFSPYKNRVDLKSHN